MKSNSIPKLFLTMVATFAIAMMQQDVTVEIMDRSSEIKA